MTIEIDHTSLSVSDFEAAKRFYAAALKPLRGGIMMEFPADVTGNVDVCGLGADGKPFLWLANAGKTSPHVHLAFRAETREQVDAFHAAAIAAGGMDNGPPGLRPLYHANYYSAFVLDAEGHNVEVVCHVDPTAVVERAPAKRAAPRKRSAASRKAAATRKRATVGKRAAAKKPAAKKRRAASKKPAPSRKRPAARKAPPRRRPAGRKPTRRR